MAIIPVVPNMAAACLVGACHLGATNMNEGHEPYKLRAAVSSPAKGFMYGEDGVLGGHRTRYTVFSELGLDGELALRPCRSHI